MTSFLVPPGPLALPLVVSVAIEAGYRAPRCADHSAAPAKPLLAYLGLKMSKLRPRNGAGAAGAPDQNGVLTAVGPRSGYRG